MGEKESVQDNHRKILEDFSKGIAIMDRLLPYLLGLTIMFMFTSGFLTWYGLSFMNLKEMNANLIPLLRYGNQYVLLYDSLASLTLVALFGFCSKSALAWTPAFEKIHRDFLKHRNSSGVSLPTLAQSDIKRIDKFLKAFRLAFVLMMFFGSVFNLLNDAGMVFGIPMLYRIFQPMIK